MSWPSMLRIEQVFDHPSVDDPAAAASEALSDVLSRTGANGLAGASVAVTVGSRGIANLTTMLRTIVAGLRDLGAEPFIVPAMGSHGGATAEGQVSVLSSLGVTLESVGAEVRSSMDTAEVGRTQDDFPVVIDRIASEADHILVINRVKPHTEFFGPYQSGLMKMLLIGLGKHTGAINYHRAATRIPFERLIGTAGTVVIERANILAGIAILENAYEQTAEVVGVAPGDFLTEEGELIKRATGYLPGIPFDFVDLLIVDEMGKNVSGAGMDTNVIRRKHWADVAEGETVEHTAPRRVFVRDLTDKTEGNAAGVGLADFALERLARKFDRHKTYTNTITATRPRGAMLPLTYETDREAIEMALASAGVPDAADARIVRILNTLSLIHMEASESLMDSVTAGATVRSHGQAPGIRFDDAGMLTPDRLDV